jgi:hypothetical protein
LSAIKSDGIIPDKLVVLALAAHCRHQHAQQKKRLGAGTNGDVLIHGLGQGGPSGIGDDNLGFLGTTGVLNLLFHAHARVHGTPAGAAGISAQEHDVMRPPKVRDERGWVSDHALGDPLAWTGAQAQFAKNVPRAKTDTKRQGAGEGAARTLHILTQIKADAVRSLALAYFP